MSILDLRLALAVFALALVPSIARALEMSEGEAGAEGLAPAQRWSAVETRARAPDLSLALWDARGKDPAYPSGPTEAPDRSFGADQAPAQPRTVAQEVAVKPGGYRWLAEGPFAGPLYLIISIDRQMMHVYDGDRLIGVASVSTGMSGHRTPQGEFPVLQKREWHQSNIYSNAPMPFMQRLTWTGIALHAGHNPGYPASHGCIRLPQAFAKQLFALTQLGTLVRVTGDQLRPALMLDTLVLNDPGTAVVTFTPGVKPPTPTREAPVELAVQEAPVLSVDASVFRPRLRW